MLMFTGSDNDIMTTSELLEIVRMKKAALHALLMDKEIFPNRRHPIEKTEVYTVLTR